MNNRDIREGWTIPAIASVNATPFDNVENGLTAWMAAHRLHPDGVNALLADVHVWFIKTSIDTKWGENGCGSDQGVWPSIRTRVADEIVSTF